MDRRTFGIVTLLSLLFGWNAKSEATQPRKEQEEQQPEEKPHETLSCWKIPATEHEKALFKIRLNLQGRDWQCGTDDSWEEAKKAIDAFEKKYNTVCIYHNFGVGWKVVGGGHEYIPWTSQLPG